MVVAAIGASFLAYRATTTLERIDRILDRTQTTTSTLYHGGATIKVETQRGIDETLDNWMTRHKEALHGSIR